MTQTLSFPDPTKNRKGFNPIEYPDLHFTYRIRVTPVGDGDAFKISVDLDQPLPRDWEGMRRVRQRMGSVRGGRT